MNPAHWMLEPAGTVCARAPVSPPAPTSVDGVKKLSEKTVTAHRSPDVEVIVSEASAGRLPALWSESPKLQRSPGARFPATRSRVSLGELVVETVARQLL